MNPVSITINNGCDTRREDSSSNKLVLSYSMSVIETTGDAYMHNSQYTQVPFFKESPPLHREGGYYVDSDVATHFASAMCYRQTHAGATSHSTSPDLTSAPPSWVSPLSEIRRHSLPPGGLLPPVLDDRAPRTYLKAETYGSDKFEEASASGDRRGRGK